MLSRQLRIDCFGKRRARHRDLPGPRGDRHLRARARRLRGHRKRFVEGFELPQAEDIANAIAFAIAAPIAVNVGHMEITPTAAGARRPFDRAAGDAARA